jgi:GTP-binding protein
MSFRREAHVPKGGPDGGDGGHGGSVVLRVDDSLRDLQSFKRKAHYQGAAGAARRGFEPPRRRRRRPRRPRAAGHAGHARGRHRPRPDRPGQQVTVPAAGWAGRGNKHFSNATRQAPRFSERGLPGIEGWIELRLKLLADVGLVGLPNAGKSSLIGRLTRAAPKVANYPFTTLQPVLGTLESDDRQLVIADIPGLIEGASGGAGLGHEFLAHVERTRLLVHVLDLAPLDGSDPEANHATIERELRAYDRRLAGLPRILALSKADLVPPSRPRPRRGAWRERLGGTSRARHVERDRPGPRRARAAAAAPRPVEAPGARAARGPRRPRRAPGLPARRRPRLRRRSARRRRVPRRGARVERLLARHDLDNDEALAHVERRLRGMGVIARSRRRGFEPGRRRGDRRRRLRARPGRLT